MADNKETKETTDKKNVKVPDLAPKKDAKGGAARGMDRGGSSLDASRSMDGGSSLSGNKSLDGGGSLDGSSNLS